MGGIAALRAGPPGPKGRNYLRFARRAPLCQWANPPGPCAQQVLEGLRGEVKEHGGFRRALHSRMGLPRPANRNQGRPAAGWQKVADEADRRSAGVSKIRAEIFGSTERTI